MHLRHQLLRTAAAATLALTTFLPAFSAPARHAAATVAISWADDTAEPFDVIVMRNNRFTSDFVIVPVGGTLVWRNNEERSVRHDAYAEDGSFQSPLLAPGESWSFTFTQEGYYRYLCSIHDNMEAAILVVESLE